MSINIEPSIGTPVARLCGVQTPPGAVVLASTKQINEAIIRLAEEIKPWIDENPGSPVVLVGLLRGGKFYADRLESELRSMGCTSFSRMDIKVSTRDTDGNKLRPPSIEGDLRSLEGKRVLLVDDILDSGTTAELMLKELGNLPAEVKFTVLVQKNNPDMEKETRPEMDFVGLRFTDKRWFSGAGMDMPKDDAQRARESTMIIAYPPVFTAA